MCPCTYIHAMHMVGCIVVWATYLSMRTYIYVYINTYYDMCVCVCMCEHACIPDMHSVISMREGIGGIGRIG